jgi:hypothetical protein
MTGDVIVPGRVSVCNEHESAQGRHPQRTTARQLVHPRRRHPGSMTMRATRLRHLVRRAWQLQVPSGGHIVETTASTPIGQSVGNGCSGRPGDARAALQLRQERSRPRPRDVSRGRRPRVPAVGRALRGSGEPPRVEKQLSGVHLLRGPGDQRPRRSLDHRALGHVRRRAREPGGQHPRDSRRQDRARDDLRRRGLRATKVAGPMEVCAMAAVGSSARPRR